MSRRRRTEDSIRYLTLRHGMGRCLILRHGTRDGSPALVRRLSDGLELEVHYWQIDVGGSGPYNFYGIEATYNGEIGGKRMTRAVRQMRRELYERTVRDVTHLYRRGP